MIFKSYIMIQKLDFMDSVPLVKENIVAYIFENEKFSICLEEDMLSKVKKILRSTS